MSGKQLDLMCIPMNKQKEDLHYVWYKVEIRVRAEEVDLGQYEQKQPTWKTCYGVFKFKKDQNILKMSINDRLNDFIELVKEESSPLLWDNGRVLAKCFVKMYECLKNGNFPENLMYASG
jgi:hypothetical protein